MQYKFLVLDLDGTLTNDKKEITPRTLETLKRVQQSGVQLVLASGRPTYGILPLVEQLEMRHFGGYILPFNGGKIIDAATDQVIYASTLPQELVPELATIAKEGGATIISYRDEYILTEQPDNRYVGHELFLTKMKPLKVDDFAKAVDFAPDKCLIVGEPEKLLPLEEMINTRYAESISAFRSEPFFLEVVPKGIDKALSLARLSAHSGVSAQEMIAAGDGYNDISMIRYAGLGVAMANGQPSVKEAADVVTLSNEEDGVATFAEEYLLQIDSSNM